MKRFARQSPRRKENKKLKRIDNETILDTIYDLADAQGVRIDRFIELIEEEFGEQPVDLSGLPDEVVNELNAARESKKEQKRLQRAEKSEQAMGEDIRRFRELFPDVQSDDIPESVWEEVQNGVSLVHAYALYQMTESRLDARAASVNERNGNISAAATANGSTEPSFTKEQVERMSGKDVKSNYKSILKAMKNWRFN